MLLDLLPNIIFILLLLTAAGFFAKNVGRIKRNIYLGKSIDRTDQPKERWGNMARIALGQSKMVKRPIAGILHVVVYVGFILINIELLEIVVDGIVGTHRIFAPFLGGFYNILIASFEICAALVLIAVILFWCRRNVIKIQRFWKDEMKGWPKLDADLILYFEVVLMGLFLTMNGADLAIQTYYPDAPHYAQAGSFPVSQFIAPLFEGSDLSSIILIERIAWWMHIIGIFFFLNYLYYSKHLHILLAFPNTFFADLRPKGQFNNNANVTAEVQLMMDPNADPYAAIDDSAEVEKFGASDVMDLNQVQLLNAYTCTECGRCTSECPANQTGKKLSPRKVMMDTRDRLTEVGNNIEKNKGQFVDDGKQLLGDYISHEELWACTSCNACVEACPVDIDPLSIIMEMRQYLVMEESAAPSDLNNMMSNIENNGAPWPFNQQDRANWAQEL
ncbi:MAG: (Fe-S)-binding protein [Flavobacteriaceae bacterium]|nr:(Fe-S)-binding protein [Flavobacteriaceae bacterium]